MFPTAFPDKSFKYVYMDEIKNINDIKRIFEFSG